MLLLSYISSININIWRHSKHLPGRTNQQDTVFAVGLSENVATSVEDVMSDKRKAEANRHIGATDMNTRSSRSHVIFTMIIESRSHVIFRMIIESHLITGDSVRSGDGTVKVSHLNFVDLAGSENMKQSGVSGQRLAETGSINQSLSALSLVIHQLSKGEKANYRNSKLTRILQNALGGNSKTAMICTINPAALEQSVTTLRFAKCAKTINKKLVVNKVVSGETMITITKRQINRRKAQCASKHRVVDLRPLKPGEHDWVTDMNRRGTVKTHMPAPPRSYVVKTQHGDVQRNRRHLNPTPVAPTYDALPADIDIPIERDEGEDAPMAVVEPRVRQPPDVILLFYNVQTISVMHDYYIYVCV